MASTRRQAPASSGDLFAHFGVALHSPGELLSNVVDGRACPGCRWLLAVDAQRCPLCGWQDGARERVSVEDPQT